MPRSLLYGSCVLRGILGHAEPGLVAGSIAHVSCIDVPPVQTSASSVGGNNTLGYTRYGHGHGGVGQDLFSGGHVALMRAKERNDK